MRVEVEMAKPASNHANNMNIGDWAVVTKGDWDGKILYRLNARDEIGRNMWLILGEEEAVGDYGDEEWAKRIPIRILQPGEIVKITV